MLPTWHYSYFDTAVNQFLMERGVLDIHKGEVVGFVVDSGCSYFSPICFPDTVYAGIRVAKLGNSSVRYEIALYRNDDPLPCAAGHFVHPAAEVRVLQLPIQFVNSGAQSQVPDPFVSILRFDAIINDTPYDRSPIAVPI